ncbi:SIR2 family protein [Coralliovum pocilloporae]|uniref:SIR2 family protein n=1 Tax=Coralliovum pocilloporae TaxID=3066369 RepID=UPI0033076F9B
MIAIWRAINLKRLVAFTGSGTSMVYGLPAWNELPFVYARCVNEQIAQALPDVGNDGPKSQAERIKRTELLRRIQPTLAQINAITSGTQESVNRANPDAIEISFSKPFDGDVLTFFALCDEVLARLPDDESQGLSRRYLAREAFGQTVRAEEALVVRNKLSKVLRTDFKAPEKPTTHVRTDCYEGRFLRSIKHLITDVNNGQNPSAPKYDLPKDLKELFQSIGDPGGQTGDYEKKPDIYGTKLEENSEKSERDMIKVLMSDLGISRFVTLNYDVQIERLILRDQRMLEDGETEAFRDLCDETKTSRPHKKRLVIESGIEKGAISGTLDQDNIAEVVNFSAYSRRYARQVMHLHGRFDDPENLILAGSDYRNLYEIKSVARDSFSNAQRTLFDGNDVIFVGIGMSEDEIKRPLKRFLATEKFGQQHSRRAFLLFSSSSCKECTVSSQCSSCKIKDEEFVLNMHNQLGVSTILYGGPRAGYMSNRWKALAKTFEGLSDDWDKDVDTLGKTPEEITLEAEKRAEKVKEKQPHVREALSDLWSFIEGDALQSGVFDVKDTLGDSVELLTSNEHTFFVNLLAGLPRGDETLPRYASRLAALLGAACSEMGSRVTARSACAELKMLKHNAEKWWDAWNEQPFERRAVYHMASEEVSGQAGYLWVRHCPVVRFDKTITPNQWPLLNEVRSSIKEQVEIQRSRSIEEERKNRLSIARFAIERGGGQGSMVRLLLRKEVQKYIFAHDKTDAYQAAFIAHLSFSMEFASVSKALTRFLARRVAEVQLRDAKLRDDVAGPNGVLTRLVSELNKPSGDRTFQDKLQAKSLAKELAAKERDDLGDVYEKFRGLASDGNILTSDEMQRVARALFVSRREIEPRLLFEPTASSYVELEPVVERLHRLDMLRKVILKYQELVSDERLFICLGGLDRLCDRDGDAHNPMHRALFRLLTGTHEHQDLDPPFDLVLLSGKPDAPICFLSEVLPEEDVKKLKSHHYKEYSRHSKTKQVLYKWPRLGRLSWPERIVLTPDFFGNGDFERPLRSSVCLDKSGVVKEEAASRFIEWAKRCDASSLTITSDMGKVVTGMHRALWKNVGLTNMLFTCWLRAYSRDSSISINEFMMAFERRFNRDEESGILSGIFSSYRQGANNESDRDVLHDLVLRHLVLYALPVEPWVLMGCPRIYRALLKKFGDEGHKPAPDLKEQHKYDIEERTWMLVKLRGVLEELCKRGMLIQIHCSSSPEHSNGDEEAFLHHRFALHGRIREFIAYRMQLNVFDQGDTNHHQISLYCDQPKDLPTPSPLHFEMVKDILDYQRGKNRETLELTYRHSRAGRQNRIGIWDPPETRPPHHNEEHSEHAAMRLFTTDDCKAIGCSMGQLHAVAQRIRSNFSLVRSAFSAGSLSRMDVAPLTNGAMPPFELYSGWLRSILNAATGIRVNNVELSGTLDGTLLPEFINSGERDDISKGLIEFRDQLEDDTNPISDELRKKVAAGLDRLGIGPLDTSDPEDRERDRNHIAAGFDALAILDAADKMGLTCRQVSGFNRVRHPLYRDEIAWLFNERALTSLIQGRMFDAMPLYRKAREVMSHKVTPDSDTKAFNAVERRINLNYSVAKIERGKIRDARIILEDLARSSVSVRFSTPSRLEPYIIGYTALCDHLGGSFETARLGYAEALSYLSKVQELRAVAVFKRHLADLYRTIGDLDLAQNEIQLAINAASQAQQRDVLHLAYASRAQIHLVLGKRDEVEEILPQLTEYAERMGLYRHQSDALMVKARLNIADGDLGLAADAIAGSIAICTRHGLRLRKLSGLVAYGGIQYLREQDKIAHSVLKNAKAEAEHIGYQLKASRASQIMAQKGKDQPVRVNLGMYPHFATDRETSGAKNSGEQT